MQSLLNAKCPTQPIEATAPGYATANGVSSLRNIPMVLYFWRRSRTGNRDFSSGRKRLPEEWRFAMMTRRLQRECHMDSPGPFSLCLQTGAHFRDHSDFSMAVERGWENNSRFILKFRPQSLLSSQALNTAGSGPPVVCGQSCSMPGTVYWTCLRSHQHWCDGWCG